jgi:translation initiation factor IF-3
VREVMVIGADSQQLGVMPPEEALVLAQEEGLDLVEVAANSRPPVCRIMDYGRYKYEQKKKAGKPAHSATLKEIKLRPGTDQHDLNFKLNKVRDFLMDGDKVKVTVMFRGREMVHKSRGQIQLQEVIRQLGPIAKTENPPRMEGRFLSMILVGDREEVADLKRQEAVQKAAEDTESSAGKSAGDDSEEKSLQGAGEASTESEETQARE